MKYYSTTNTTHRVSFENAIFTSLAKDGGLFMPEYIPQLSKDFFKTLSEKSLHEIAYTVAHAFLENDIEEKALRTIVAQSLDFPIPLKKLDNNLFVLELFHGPTMAFKDIGARFMANVFSYFLAKRNKTITVLVATSGDTGAAVAAGFYNIPKTDVIILFPKGRVSPDQEEFLTKWGRNIQAIEIDGSFDDCQTLVKRAFIDDDIQKKLNLTSANSINIARLLPQIFYYFWALAQLHKTLPVVFSIPSGNFGNLTAGLIAKQMGLSLYKFVAATNANDVFPVYLTTGAFIPTPSKQTISNAMDVGNPNNFPRIADLSGNNMQQLKKDVWSKSFSDEETKEAMITLYKKYQYIADPHGAVAYKGIEAFAKTQSKPFTGIFFETAHPAKFRETVSEILNVQINKPEKLQAFVKKPKQVIKMSNTYSAFKEFLL